MIVYASLHNHCLYFKFCPGDGGTSSENAIELAPLEHDSSYAKKRVL